MKIDGNNDGFEASPLKVCENCVHWKEMRRHQARWRVCDHPKLDMFSSIANDSSDYARSNNVIGDVRITTGPKFGCIHWEEKK